MFRNDSVAGSWPTLLHRLNLCSTFARWSLEEAALAGYADAGALAARLDRRVYGAANDELVASLVRLAQSSDDDALLFLLHCLSGVAGGVASDLNDLHDDILTVVVGELSCQIMNFPIGRRQRAVAECLRLETRRAVLAELKPSVRNHPEWSERVTTDGRIDAVVDNAAHSFDVDDVDLSDLLQWARRAGIGQDDLQLLLETEQARASAADARPRVVKNVDHDVARAHGICARTLYRRRRRALTELQTVARDYLAAVA